MEAKPKELFIGVRDLFAILLPGAILAFFGLDHLRKFVLGPIFPEIHGEAQGWVAFGLASYLLGHFIFLAGSQVDRVYNFWRNLFHPKGSDRAYRRAKEIKERALRDSEGEEVINTFRWSKAIVTLRSPAAAAEIERLEADSKFFRSLIILLTVLAASLGFEGRWRLVVACLALIVLAFWRYCDQRWKSTETAYIYLIALDRETAPAVEQAEDLAA